MPALDQNEVNLRLTSFFCSFVVFIVAKLYEYLKWAPRRDNSGEREEVRNPNYPETVVSFSSSLIFFQHFRMKSGALAE